MLSENYPWQSRSAGPTRRHGNRTSADESRFVIEKQFIAEYEQRLKAYTEHIEHIKEHIGRPVSTQHPRDYGKEMMETDAVFAIVFNLQAEAAWLIERRDRYIDFMKKVGWLTGEDAVPELPGW